MVSPRSGRAERRKTDPRGPDEIIYLDRTDDVDTTLDRLEWVEGSRALVVVPGASDMFASLVTLKLLRRRTEAMRLTLLLVARDGLTRTLAKETGIRSFATLWGGKLALRLLQGRSGSWLKTITREPPALAASPEPEKAMRRRKKARRPADRFRLRTLPGRGRRLLYSLAALLILVASVVGLIYTVLILVPQAKVTVVPALAEVTETTLVTADPNVAEVDFVAGVIPARIVKVEVEGSAEVATTTKRDTPNQRAVGTLTFVNRTTNEVTVPMGTVARTSTGTNIRFTTVETVTVPAGIGNRAEAEVAAVTPGPSGNVGPYLITTLEAGIAVQVTAVNDAPTRGGDVRQVGVVTQADKERLQSYLLQQLRLEALARIQDQLDQQEFVPPDTLQAFVITELYDKFVDELSDTLGLKMRISANAVAIAGNYANAVALDALQNGVPSDYYLVARGLRFEQGQIDTIDENRRVTFAMTAFGTAVANIEPRGLREALSGQTLAKAEAIVVERLPVRQPPSIEVKPDWFGRMPQMPYRISVIVTAELD